MLKLNLYFFISITLKHSFKEEFIVINLATYQYCCIFVKDLSPVCWDLCFCFVIQLVDFGDCEVEIEGSYFFIRIKLLLDCWCAFMIKIILSFVWVLKFAVMLLTILWYFFSWGYRFIVGTCFLYFQWYVLNFKLRQEKDIYSMTSIPHHLNSY